MIQGLRTRGTDGVNTNLRAGEDIPAQVLRQQAKEVNSSFHLFVLFTSSRDWLILTHIGRVTYIFILLIPMLILEIPSQTDAEIIFNLGTIWPSQIDT